MRILVTGGCGFIGSNLIKALVQDRHEVHSVDNYSTGFKSNHVSGASYYEVDIANKEAWDKFLDINYEYDCHYDVVIHLAARARITPSWTNSYEYYRTNVLGTLNVVNYCNKTKAHLIYAHSSSALGNVYNPYTHSKELAYNLITHNSKIYNFPASTTYFFNVYGPNESLDPSNSTLIGKIRSCVKHGTPFTVYDGKQTRLFTHVDDVVHGLVAIMSRENITGCEEYELNHTQAYSVNEVVNMVPQGLLQVRYEPNLRPGELTHSVRKELPNTGITWKAVKNLPDYIIEVVK